MTAASRPLEFPIRSGTCHSWSRNSLAQCHRTRLRSFGSSDSIRAVRAFRLDRLESHPEDPDITRSCLSTALTRSVLRTALARGYAIRTKYISREPANERSASTNLG